jgi:hypothetical protein
MATETKIVQRIPFHWAVGILVAALLIPGLFLGTWSFTNWIVFITWAEFFVFGGTPAAWKRMIAPNAIGAVTAAVWMVNWVWFESLFKINFQNTVATWLILAVTNFIWVVGIVYAIGVVKVLKDNGLSTFGGLTVYLAAYFSFLGGAKNTFPQVGPMDNPYWAIVMCCIWVILMCWLGYVAGVVNMWLTFPKEVKQQEIPGQYKEVAN